MKTALFAACSAALLPLVAVGAPEQASIPFATTTGIKSWRAAGNDTLYIQSRADRWYKADLFGPCIGLQFDPTIGFVVRFGSTFDRSSSILVDGRECKLSSLVEVAGPPEEGSGTTAESPDTRRRDSTAQESGKSNESGAAVRGADSATNNPSAQTRSASIPFADLDGIRDWQAAGDDLLYVQGRNGQWYRANLFGTCVGLRFQDTIGFVVEPTGSFDKFSSIVVDGRECPLASLTKTDAPPASRRASAND